MAQQQYTTKRRKGQHLTLIEGNLKRVIMGENIGTTVVAD